MWAALMTTDHKIMQPVVRTVRDSPFVHFYLECGHLITMTEQDLKEGLPSSMECWACEGETKKKAYLM